MGKRFVCLAGVAVLVAGIAAAQPPGEYLDLYVVKVKQDKRFEFDTAVKKVADLNRRHGGDQWIAYSALYGGENGTVYFVSRRENMAAVGTGMEAFDKALAKGIGAANVPKFFSDFSSTLASERGEIRMRRSDLSLNFPDSPEGRDKLIAETRFLRSTIVRAKPGMTPGVLEVWGKIRSAMENQESKPTISVLQAMTGPGGVFYFTSYAKSLADLDSQSFDLKKALGEEGYQSLQKDMSEVVAESRVEIYRMSPELSNPPETFMSLAPEFWKPKPAVAATKGKPAGSSVSSQ